MIAYVMNLDETGNLTKQSVDAGFIGINGNIINDNAAPWLIKNFIPVGQVPQLNCEVSILSPLQAVPPFDS